MFFNFINTYTIFDNGFILKPHLLIFLKIRLFLNIIGSTAPNPYAKYLRGIFEVSLDLFVLRDPPAAFLGLANLSLIL